jgi:putative FmdB family regulatory protein
VSLTFPKLQKKSAALCDFWKERLSVSSAYQRTSISSLLARCLRKQFCQGVNVERIPMASYEFRCRKCDLNFELMFSFGQYRKKIKPIRCPNCNSTRVVRRISLFEVKTSKKS